MDKRAALEGLPLYLIIMVVVAGRELPHAVPETNRTMAKARGGNRVIQREEVEFSALPSCLSTAGG